MKVERLRLAEVLLIAPDCFLDERGFFLESYRAERYQEEGIRASFVQDNHSYSKKHTLRGMHFSPKQSKLVSVVVGKIYDVAVDVRPSSKTFGQWVAVVLDGQKHQQLFIPEGFAHGFCVLSAHAHVTYKVSTPYRAELEQTFRFDDPDCKIEWPFSSFILSDRDRNAPFLRDLVVEGR